MKITFSSNFDGDSFKKQAYVAAEKAFKESVQKKLTGLNGVRVSFSGSAERGDLKANVSGSDEKNVAEAKKRLAAK